MLDVDMLIFDFLAKAGAEYGITEEDLALKQRAESTISLHYARGFHQLASVALGVSGTIYEGLQHDAKIGQASGCAEFFAIHNAEVSRDRLKTIVTARRAKDEEGGQIHLVTPCGMCRERLFQFCPEVKVIVPFNDGIIKLPIQVLLPAAYAVRARPVADPERLAQATQEWAVAHRSNVVPIEFSKGKPWEEEV